MAKVKTGKTLVEVFHEMEGTIMKYEIIFDGSMSTIVESTDGENFQTCKKELLEYIDEKIKDLKSVKSEIRSMRKRDLGNAK